MGLSQDLENITEITYDIISGNYPQVSKGYEKALVKSLRRVISPYKLYIFLDKEDIRQQIYTNYLKFKSDFKSNTPQFSMISYIVSRTIWEIRDWIVKQYSSKYVPGAEWMEKGITKEEEDSFKVDIYFLIRGNTTQPFSLLNAYERYILYLRYGKEMTIQEMAGLIQKSKPTIRKHIKYVIDKLGENSL